MPKKKKTGKSAKRTTKKSGRSTARTRESSSRRGESGSAPPKVRVRMYRHGLGDCFLLTFYHDNPSRVRHVLIDFGSLGATTTKVNAKEVAEDIVAEAKGRLSLLVVTHEHSDHVAGFLRQEKLFKDKDKLTVERVWQAWTERPDDDLAQKLQKYKHDLGVTLASVVRSPGAADIVPEVSDLIGFFGDDHVLGASKFAKTVNEAMELVRVGFGVEACYLEPKPRPIEPDWLPGFRFYVLGPSRDEARLSEMGDHASEELYHVAVAGYPAGAPLKQVAACDAEEERFRREMIEGEMPFDRRFRCRPPYGPRHYPDYFAKEHEWRSIDSEYLQLGSNLALQLDSITNNTSLALAIERITDGKVLLFPGDAQQGSWLSWHDHVWTVNGEDGDPRVVSVEDLLANTVFYKVGHHGSHNATARGKGLELMTRKDELTAFIPVDRKVALKRHPKGSWKMPATALYRRLLEQCNGRVLRSDLGWAAEASSDTERAFEGLATAKEWRDWKRAQKAAKHVDTRDRLFFDFLLE